MNYLLIAMLGGCTGLRCMTPIAVLCWFAYRNALHFQGWRSFTANLIAVVIFTLAAVGEYVADKLPNTPARTALPGLSARIVFSAFIGALLAQMLLLSLPVAMLLGAVGAVIGAYTGWFVRTRSVAALKSPDWPIAILEDCVTIGLSITFLHLVAFHSAMFAGNEGVYLR